MDLEHSHALPLPLACPPPQASQLLTQVDGATVQTDQLQRCACSEVRALKDITKRRWDLYLILWCLRQDLYGDWERSHPPALPYTVFGWCFSAHSFSIGESHMTSVQQ